ncbi:MAG: hypothetical protein M1274_05675 [Actinobacteria bacterium]|nr:hypothetical protein [Actinomycetota bacterium]
MARVLLDEMDPSADPLGSESTLVLATTALAATGVGCVNRLSVGCKSPMTGGIKEANVGGSFSTLMAQHGLRMMLLQGSPQQEGMWIVHVDANGTAALEPAGDCEGLNNYELVRRLKERYGNRIAVASIGLAGERGYKNSSVQVTEYGTDYPNRAAARGGTGSVMGSKRVKAVIFEKPAVRATPALANQEEFERLKAELNQVLGDGAAVHEIRHTGTPAAVRLHHANGVLPVRNFSGKHMVDIDRIYPERFMEIVRARGETGRACQAGCRIRCSNQVMDEAGEYVTGGLEYETIALCGANTLIADLDAIARIDHFCDDLGVDTIETGATLGVCMEAGKIPWGDAEAAMGLLREMGEATEFGRIMGAGTEAVGRHLGADRIPVVHHMAIPGYDIRGAAPTGVAFAGGAQGADHTTCPSLGTFEEMTPEEICAVSYAIQRIFATYDNLMCIFAALFLEQHLAILAALYAAEYGGDPSVDRLLELGDRTLRWEKEFNRAAGWQDGDDVLPAFFYAEASEMAGAAFRVPQQVMSQTVKL